MQDVSTEIMVAIEWGIVPLILIGILARFLMYTPGEKASDKIKKSSAAGKFAGLIIFALFVLSQKSRALLFSFNMPVYDFNILVILVSIATGFIFSWIFDLIKKRLFIGLYTLLAVASTTTAIYCYLFIQNLRSYLVFVTMGIMLGALIYAIFLPKETISGNETASQRE
jgi:hypothetical protein